MNRFALGTIRSVLRTIQLSDLQKGRYPIEGAVSFFYSPFLPNVRLERMQLASHGTPLSDVIFPQKEPFDLSEEVGGTEERRKEEKERKAKKKDRQKKNRKENT